MEHAPTSPVRVQAVAEAAFANTPTQHIFHYTYAGPPRPFRDYLVGRFRWGRSAQWQAQFYPERVRLNGERVDAHTVVQPDDRVEYLHWREEEPPEPPPLPVLHEDEWLLAVHKPDSVPVDPGGVFYFSSLALLMRERRGEPEFTPLHRLDLETSGVLLSARRRAEVGRWHQLFTDKSAAETLRKTYRALVHGHVPEHLREIRSWLKPAGGRIQTRLRLVETTAEGTAEGTAEATNEDTAKNTSKDTAARTAKRIAEHGHVEPSLTRILTVRHHTTPRGRFSELELEPVTGKTNQLRVHLAHVGHPIVGDKKYHPDEGVFLDWLEHRDFARLREVLVLERQALQCETLAFTHPFSHQPLEIRALAGSWAGKIAPVLPSALAASLAGPSSLP